MEKMQALMIILAIYSAAKVSVTEAESVALQDFCVGDLDAAVQVNGYPCRSKKSVTADDFVSTLLRTPENVTENLGSYANLITVDVFPALNTQGISLARIDFAPHGLNPPHVHPRGAEAFHVISGTLYSGFVSTDNTLYATTLQAGDTMVFPMGLLHFQMNLNDTSAVALASLSSQNPGRWDLALSLFDSDPLITDALIKKNFVGLKDKDVALLRKVVSKAYAVKANRM